MRRALLIGINYTLDPRNRLYGCVNDVRNVERKLRATRQCAEYRVLQDQVAVASEWPSRKNILAALAWLVAGLVPGDRVFLHYSGHGGLTVDRSGDEATGLDSCVYPIDESGKVETIVDDELRVLLDVPAGCTLTAVFDCCHSGSCLDLRYTLKGADAGVCLSEDKRQPKTRGQILMLSGCTDQQTAADTVDASGTPSGALTNALLAAMDRGVKLTRLLADVRDVLRKGGYAQTPQMSCGRAALFVEPFL
jgi:hypothetical protein